jgi:hypothetical protein
VCRCVGVSARVYGCIGKPRVVLFLAALRAPALCVVRCSYIIHMNICLQRVGVWCAAVATAGPQAKRVGQAHSQACGLGIRPGVRLHAT